MYGTISLQNTVHIHIASYMPTNIYYADYHCIWIYSCRDVADEDLPTKRQRLQGKRTTNEKTSSSN